MAQGERPAQRVSGPCGTTLRIDIMKADRKARCPNCGMTLAFVVTMDNRTRRPGISLVISADAMKVEGESLAQMPHAKAKGEPDEDPPAPVETSRTRVGGRTIKGVLGTCTACDTAFPVDDRELTSIQPCPNCGVEFHVVTKIVPGTKKKTAILVPVKLAPARRQTVAPPSSPTRAIKRTQVAKPARSVTLPPGAQGVPCTCGDLLVVRKKDVAAGMTCPNCGKAVKFQESIHPQTMVPILRVKDSKK